MYGLLTKRQVKMAGIGQVLFLRVYGPRRRFSDTNQNDFQGFSVIMYIVLNCQTSNSFH